MTESTTTLAGVLARLLEYRRLTRQEARDILADIAAGKYNESQIAAFITTYLMRGVSVDEILGFREALLETRVNLDALQEYDPIDIVGTGGDGKNTFNISTAACIVVAAAGYKVVKHGNHGATSVSGASNVMEEHGVVFTRDVQVHRRSLDRANIAYLHAPLFHPALKIVAPVRKALAARTFFNILGPLVNPVMPRRQVLGVYDLKMARLYNYIYQESGNRFAIVHSLDGYDEASLTGPFKVIAPEGEQILSPKDMGLPTVAPADLAGGNSPAEAARLFSDVLDNRAGESRAAVVVANAAIAIRTIKPHASLGDCIREADDALRSGKARRTFDLFLDINR
ncbi:MAG: anthranilate phosphoribosyltransferase [Odoribacteraceae bacterium]|jgi:anthranilate phosphoribosyltransferase|nr:anthranilate phosphoribosyltransferase [Odoribacteraceae bacterium]